MRFRSGLLAMLLLGLLVWSGYAGGQPDSTARTAPGVNFNPTGYPIVDEPITLTMMGITTPALHDDWGEILFFQRMEEMTNIRFDFMTTPVQAYEERKNLAFASGDLPDVFFKGRLSRRDQMAYGGPGNYLIPLEGLIEQYGPYLSRLFQVRPEVEQAITMPSGHIVVTPNVEPARTIAMFFINKAWLDALDLSEPQSLEEFYETLKAFKEGDPNRTGRTDDAFPMSVTGVFGIKRFMANFGLLFNEADIFVDETGQVIFSPLQDEYREGLLYFRRLFSEGLLDNESFTQTGGELNAKGQSNQLGVFLSLAAWPQVGDHHWDYVSLIPFPTADGTRVYEGTNGIDPNGAFAITSLNQHPEATLRWVDYLYSEEGGILEQYGREGEDWEWQPDGRWTHILKEGETMGDKNRRVAIHAGGNVPHLRPQDFIDREVVGRQNWLFAQWDRITEHARMPFPPVYFEDVDQRRVNSFVSDIITYVDEMTARFITGDASIEREWSTYVDTLNRMGVRDLVRLYEARLEQRR